MPEVKQATKKAIISKKNSARALDAREGEVYEGDVYDDSWLYNIGRNYDYVDVDARITATLEGGVRTYTAPDSSFRTQLQLNYSRLHRDNTSAEIVHRNKIKKYQDRLSHSEKRHTNKATSYDVFGTPPLDEFLAALGDSITKYKLKKRKSKTANFSDNFDKRLLSHSESRKLLKASGAAPQEALCGSIIDDMLGIFLLQLVKLPVSLAFSTAATKTELSLPGKSGLLEVGATGKAVLGELGKPALSSLSRRARIVKTQINADEVLPETKRALEQFNEQIVLLSKKPQQEKNKADFKKLEDTIRDQCEALLKKEKSYNQLTSAAKKKYLNATVQVVGFLIQISGRAVGHAVLLSVGAVQLTKLIPMLVRPAIVGLSRFIESWYDERAIATRAQRQFNEHMQSLQPGEEVAEVFINNLAHQIQDNFEPAPLANYNRMNENIFQPELLQLDEHIQFLESQVSLLDQKSKALSHEELVLIERQKCLLEESSSYVENHSRKYLAFDTVIVEEIISYIKDLGIGEAAAVRLLELNLPAIFGALARGDEKNNKLIDELNAAFEGAGKKPLMEVLLPLAQNKYNALITAHSFSNGVYHPSGIYIDLSEDEGHFLEAYNNVLRLFERKQNQQRLNELRGKTASDTLDKKLLSKRQSAESKLTELNRKLKEKQRKRDVYQKDVKAYLALDHNGISHEGPVWQAHAKNKRGVGSAVRIGLKNAPERILNKLMGRSDKAYKGGAAATLSTLISSMVISPTLIAGSAIRNGLSTPAPAAQKVSPLPLEAITASLGLETTATLATPASQLPDKPSRITPRVDPGRGLTQTRSVEKSAESPTSAPHGNRLPRSAGEVDAACRIIEPQKVDSFEKGLEQLAQYKKTQGWGEYEAHYVHTTDSSGNTRIVLRHPVSGLQVQMDVSSGDRAQMPDLGALADYCARRTADQIADPIFQDVARTSLGLPDNAVFKAVTASGSELTVRYFDPISGIETSKKMSLDAAGLGMARQMASKSTSAKAADRIDKFASFISLLTQGYPQDAQSAIGYTLDLFDTVEGAAKMALKFAGLLEKLRFSRTVGTLLKLGLHDLLKQMDKAAPVLAAVGVALGIKSIIDLSREYANASAPRQKAIVADLFFAVTGTVGNVAVLGMGALQLTGAGPVGLALAVVALMGMGISSLVNLTAQTEEQMIRVAKGGVQLVKNMQMPMTVKTEGGHTTITLHRPGSVKIKDGRAIFTPDAGGVQIKKATISSHNTHELNSMPTSTIKYGDYEDIEAFMEVNEVSAPIHKTGSLTIVDASKRKKITPEYSPWVFESRNYQEIEEFDRLLGTISGGSQRQTVFKTKLQSGGWSRVLTGLKIDYESAAPTRISSDQPYVLYASDNKSDIGAFTIQGGSRGIATRITPQSTLNVGSTGGSVDIILPEAIEGKQVVRAGTPVFQTLPNGQLRIVRTMKARAKKKTEQEIQAAERALQSNVINLNPYNEPMRKCKASAVTKGALRFMLTRYLQWSQETLPSAALNVFLDAELKNTSIEFTDPELLAAMEAVPKGQKLTDNERVKIRLSQLAHLSEDSAAYHYNAVLALQAVEDFINPKFQEIIQYVTERDGVDETWTSDITFNPKEDFTFTVNEFLTDNVNAYKFEVKKDGKFTQGDTVTFARPIPEESAPLLKEGIDATLYDAGQNIGTSDAPEYVYKSHDGAFYKEGNNLSGAPQMEPVDIDLVQAKRASRGLLRDLSAILKWAREQQGNVLYFHLGHADGPSITVEPGGYLATHYPSLLRTGPNGSKTLFLRQIPSALTGFKVPDLQQVGNERIYLTADQHQANITALEAKIGRLLSYRSGKAAENSAEISTDIGKEIVSFDEKGVERLTQIVVNSDVGVHPVSGRATVKVANQFYDFSDISRTYSDVIKIQTGSRQFFFRPSTKKLIMPPSDENRPLVYLGVGADGEDVFGLQDTTSEFAYFTLPAAVRNIPTMGYLSRVSTITRAQLKDFGIFDPVAGPQWITGKGGARIRTVTTPLGGDVYVLEDVNGLTRTRIKGASSWTAGLTGTATGLEAHVYGFDLENSSDSTLLRAQPGKAATFVGVKTDQVSPVRVEGGGHVLLRDDFNRPLTFVLSAQNSNVLELDWSKWTAQPVRNPSSEDWAMYTNGNGGSVLIKFAPGATLRVRDMEDEAYSLDARKYTSAQALAERLATSASEVALGASNFGALYWDPLRKTLIAQKDGVTRKLGSLSAPIRYLDDAGTQMGIVADAPGHAIDLPILGMKTYEVGLGKGNTLTLSRSFIQQSSQRSNDDTFVYADLDTLATGEFALVKLDPSQWPVLGHEVAQADGSVTIDSKGAPPVVLRLIPPAGKRIQLSLQEGTSDTWKATVVDRVTVDTSNAAARARYGQTTWEPTRSRRPRAALSCMLMPVRLLRRVFGRGRDHSGGRIDGASNEAGRVESVMQSNLRNAQGIEIAGAAGGRAESNGFSSQSPLGGAAMSSQAGSPQRSGGQSFARRALTKMRKGGSSGDILGAFRPLESYRLDSDSDFSRSHERSHLPTARTEGLMDSRSIGEQTGNGVGFEDSRVIGEQSGDSQSDQDSTNGGRARIEKRGKGKNLLIISDYLDMPMEEGAHFAHEQQGINGRNIFGLGNVPAVTDRDLRFKTGIKDVTSIKDAPQGLAHITGQDQLDILGHGYPGSIKRYDGVRLNGDQLAHELVTWGLKEVGDINVIACNILKDNAQFLVELRDGLVRRGVKIKGTLSGTRSYVSHSRVAGRTYRDQPTRDTTDPTKTWRSIEPPAQGSGNATVAESLSMTVEAPDAVLNADHKTITIPNGLQQRIRLGAGVDSATALINFSGSGRAIVDLALRGDLVVEFTGLSNQVVNLDSAMLSSATMFDDLNYFGLIYTDNNGKNFRLLMSKHPVKSGAIQVSGQEKPFIFYTMEEFRLGLARGFKPLPKPQGLHNVGRSDQGVGIEMSGRVHPGASSAEASASGGDHRLWEQLDREIPHLDSNTQDNIKFGMGVVNFVRTIGEEAHLGGSLVASAFGGPRVPQDIDIDVSNLEYVKLRFSKMSNNYFVVGNDVFKIAIVTKIHGGYEVEYQHLKVDSKFDPQTDMDELNELDFSRAKTKKTIVDFSNKSIFDSLGLVLNKDIGHTDVGFLVAAYLIRMDTAKGDAQQVEGMVKRLKENGKTDDEIRGLIRSNVKPGSVKANIIEQRLQIILKNIPPAQYSQTALPGGSAYRHAETISASNRAGDDASPISGAQGRTDATLGEGVSSTKGKADPVRRKRPTSGSSNGLPMGNAGAVKTGSSVEVNRKHNIGNLIRYSVQQESSSAASRTALFSSHGVYYHSSVGVVAPENLTVSFLAPHGNFLAEPTVEFIVNSQGKWSSFVDVRGKILHHNDFRRPDYNLPHQPQRGIEDSFGTTEEGKIRDYQYYHYHQDPTDANIFSMLTTNEQSAMSGQATKMDLLTLSDVVEDPRYSSTGIDFSFAQLIEMHNNGQLVNSDGLPYERIIMSHCRAFVGLPEDPTYSFQADSTANDFLKGQVSAGRQIDQLIQTTITFDTRGAPVIQETLLGYIVRPSRSRVRASTCNDETQQCLRT